jgi:hypothetical protein
MPIFSRKLYHYQPARPARHFIARTADAGELPGRDVRACRRRVRHRRCDGSPKRITGAGTFAGTGTTGGCEAAYRARLTPARLTSCRRVINLALLG